MKLSSHLALLLALAPAVVFSQAPPAPLIAAPLPTDSPPMPAVSACVLEPYPAASVSAGATGRTIVGFSVNENGDLFETIVLRTAGATKEHKLLDAAAARTLW